jgi:hypothetical protein
LLAKKSGEDLPRPGIVGVDRRSIAKLNFLIELPILRNEARPLQNKTPRRDSALHK